MRIPKTHTVVESSYFYHLLDEHNRLKWEVIRLKKFLSNIKRSQQCAKESQFTLILGDKLNRFGVKCEYDKTSDYEKWLKP